MNQIINFWNNFKNQPDIWFFYGFLLTFTFSVRKVILYFPIQGTFNEYTGIYVYISDIFLFLAIILWIIFILCNNKLHLSRYLPPTKNVLKTNKNILKAILVGGELWITYLFHRLYLILPLFLVFLSFLSILWSENLSIALFRSFKLLEFYLLYLYIIFRFVPQLFYSIETSNVPRLPETKMFHACPVNLKCSTWNILGFYGVEHSAVLQSRTISNIKTFFSIIIFLGLFQAIIGIIQFFLQSSIGLFWLKESLISPDILGVAKIILNGQKVVRSYGLMPHPNILGGFLLFSIITTLLYQKLLQSEIVPRLSADKVGGTFWMKLCSKLNLNCSTWNNLHALSLKKWFKILSINFNTHKNWLFTAIITLQTIALALTFSKSAIIGIILALVYIYIYVPHKSQLFHPVKTSNVPRGTLEVHGASVEQFQKQLLKYKKVILIILILLVSFSIFAKPDINSIFTKSLKERILYLNVPYGTFLSDPILGIGAGQSVISMQKFFQKTLDSWEYQPIHNVFLIILAELGLLGLVLFIWWLWKLFHAVTTLIVPRPPRESKLFHVEQFGFLRGGTISEKSTSSHLQGEDCLPADETRDEVKNDKYILEHNNIILSNIVSIYFKGILIGFIFIMLFDHYLWDIQQGSLIFWLTTGIILGIKTMQHKKSA